MRYISTSFSTRMLNPEVKSIEKEELTEEEAIVLATDWISSGDVKINCPFESTAKILSAKLGIHIEPQATRISVMPGDQLLQFTLKQRPPEGEVLTEEQLQNWPINWLLLTFKAEPKEVEEMPTKIYLANAFTPAMLAPDTNGFSVTEIDEDTAKEILQKIPFVSSIGHEATAAFISELAGVNVPANRVSIQAHPGEAVLVLEIALPRGVLIQDPEELKQYPRKWKIVDIW